MVWAGVWYIQEDSLPEYRRREHSARLTQVRRFETDNKMIYISNDALDNSQEWTEDYFLII